MKKIETKIAKTGTKMYYVEGKRVNREVAIQTAADNRGGAFIINREKRTRVYSVVSYVASGEYARIATYEFNKIYFKTTFNGTELWVNPDAEKFGAMVFGSYNKERVKGVATAIETAFINGEKGVTVKANGTVEVINAEADPDDYAVSQEALEVATNAEIEAMKVAREERIKAAQKEVADYIAKIDEQEKQEKVAAFERELAEYYAERELANNEHAPEYKYYIKSRRPIAGAVPKGYISATAGEMRAYSFCADGSISRVPRKVVFGVVSYDHPLSDEQIINYDLHVDPRNPNTTTNNAETIDKEETQMTKQAEFYADKIRRDAQPCDDNDEAFNLIPDVSELNDVEIDEASPANTLVADIEEDDVEELNPIVETKITKRSLDSVSLKLNGKRISLHNLEDALDAPRTNFAVINEYGKKYDCRRCSKDYYGFFGTSPEEYTIHFNTLGELVKHYAFDNIVRDTASETPVDSTLTANIAKYQAAFDEARQISIRAGSGVCKINGEEIWFNYGNLRSISSDNYRAEITFNNGRKRFRYRGIVIKRADFLDRMSNEIVAAEQKEIFGKFYDDYQMPDTTLDPNADYFQIRIFPKFANGTESSFHATANDFKRALELIELFKSLNLPFIGLIKRNTVCGEEYYRHNRDGSETINPPEIDNTPANKEPYRPFTPKEEVDIINHNINWAKGILTTMQGDTYTDDMGEEWTRSKLETAIIDWQDEIADLQPQADKTAEPPKPVELVAPTVMGALETINEMFPLDGFVEDVSKPNFKSAVNGDWRLNIFIDKNGTPEAVSLAEDDQLFLTVKIKARSLRDSINRAIKTCVKNRIAYRKNHNAEMEKYEYELMHLLQAARRELEVA